jgi:hypothetical protein
VNAAYSSFLPMGMTSGLGPAYAASPAMLVPRV